MGYRLGIDLGTTFTAAATGNGQAPAMLGLGNRALQIPSVLFLQEDGQFLVGEAAERRGFIDPARVVREFKRRMGDPVPLLVAGAPFSAQALTARLLAWVVAAATERMGAAPDEVVLTYPANWGAYKRELLDQVIAMADVGRARTCPEPQAAAIQYAARARLDPGARVAVYDLGGGTFDVCVLEKTRTGFVLLGSPEGIEHLGGVDFDEAVFQHVAGSLGPVLDEMDLDAPGVRAALVRLRRDCVEAKEALSADVDTVIQVALPGRSTSVRLTRAELESLIGPALQDTVDATARALRAADTTSGQLSAIVLVGGSSRIPMVSHLLQGHFVTPTALDTHPKHDIALGAVQFEPGDSAAALAPPKASTAATPEAGATTLDLSEAAATTLDLSEAAATTLDLPEAAATTLDLPEAAATPPRAAATATPAPAPEDAVAEGSAPAGPAPDDPDGLVTQPLPAQGPGGPRKGLGERLGDLSPRARWGGGIGAVLAAAACILLIVQLVGREADQSGGDAARSVPTQVGTTTTGTTQTGTPTVPSGALPASDPPLGASEILVPLSVKSGTSGLDLYLGDVTDPAKRVRLTSDPGDELAPALSPDRRSMIYAQRPPDGSGGTPTMWVSGVDGTNRRPLFKAVPPQCAKSPTPRPGWSSKDPTLLAVNCEDSGGVHGLYLIGLDGTIVRRLDTADAMGDPAFSPDGTKIVYWANRGSDHGLRVVSADGKGKPRKLTAGEDVDPAWSPTGDGRIAFRRALSGESAVLLVMDEDGVDVDCDGSAVTNSVDGKRMCRITDGADFDQDPSWSPDGNQIAYKGGLTDAEIKVVAARGGAKPKRLWPGGPGAQQAPVWTTR